MSRPLLEIRNLSKRFDGLDVLRDVQLTVWPGDVLGIVGPNGAGKSTLFHLLAGSWEPTAGEVFYQGRRITSWPPERRVRAGIARVFQQARLFYGLTVEENVRIGCFLQEHVGLQRLLPGVSRRERATLRARIEDILRQTGLEPFRDRTAAELSYGYRRRLQVALALGTRPRLLLLDEPFAGQSPEGAAEMGRLIRRLRASGLTILMIEHRMESIVSYCTRLLVMRDGRIVLPRLPQTHAAR